jgi:hypothetical protein
MKPLRIISSSIRSVRLEGTYDQAATIVVLPMEVIDDHFKLQGSSTSANRFAG